MRRKLRVFREQFFKIAAFVILGAVLFWVYKRRVVAAEYIPAEYVRVALIIALLLYLIYGISLLQGLGHSGWLRRFDPGDPDSLNELAEMKRYKLPAKYAALVHDEGDELLENIHLYLRSRGFSEQIRRSFGLVYERKLFGVDSHLRERWQRVIVLYRPLLNVIVVDQMLKEAIDYIDRSSPYANMNQYILLTDMENDQEVLSAAAGVVNFLGKLNKSYLSPILIDQNEGRLFFPSDRSLISFRQKLFHDFFRYDFVLFLKRERKSKLNAQSAKPIRDKEPRLGRQERQPRAGGGRPNAADQRGRTGSARASRGPGQPGPRPSPATAKERKALAQKELSRERLRAGRPGAGLQAGADSQSRKNPRPGRAGKLPSSRQAEDLRAVQPQPERAPFIDSASNQRAAERDE
ncbi:MAG: hypothetical protein Q4P08_02825 [Eubacteriales bacterium]|nr:hypothetical protein [Eubacteriales bacterium]